jgi:uncharacterized protein (UPF0548 family)
MSVAGMTHGSEHVFVCQGTGPGEGEEIFLVRRQEGRVWFEVTASSRPRDTLARLGSPVTRWLQVRTNKTYLQAIRQVADDGA